MIRTKLYFHASVFKDLIFSVKINIFFVSGTAPSLLFKHVKKVLFFAGYHISIFCMDPVFFYVYFQRNGKKGSRVPDSFEDLSVLFSNAVL